MDRGFLAWEARSGFLVEDSGGDYTVTSKGLDPEQPDFAENQSKGGIAPYSVRIEKQLEDGSLELWSYNYRTGVRERTDSSTGEVFRETFIVSPGPAYGELRRREKKGASAESWKLIEQRAYNPDGRLIRVIGGNEVRELVWEERGEFSRVQEFVEGELTKERVFENGRRVRTTEWGEGKPTTYTYELEGGQEIVRQFVEGEWQWTRIWNSSGRIVYGNNNEGFESIFRYGSDGIREVLQKRPDGKDFLVRTSEGESVRITDPEKISAWLSDQTLTGSHFRKAWMFEGSMND
ncbi:hypothetical protein [Puniceicoccus vermicola]|uniref:RHS repeat protein n=1 Tax=Puniceicoccus vermicola TaxID=388746 RepID=A0A7X1E4C3_9BACT|nr:hypothetical protein [Puniceicoccus vermicola]